MYFINDSSRLLAVALIYDTAHTKIDVKYYDDMQNGDAFVVLLYF